MAHACKETYKADTQCLLNAVDQTISTYLTQRRSSLLQRITDQLIHNENSSTQPENSSTFNTGGIKEFTIRSILRDINAQRHPHITSVKTLINYLLMGNKTVDYGLVVNSLLALRIFYPVNKHPEYYHQILNDRFAIVQRKTKSEATFFWFLIEEILSLSAIPLNLDAIETNVENFDEEKTENNTEVFFNDLRPDEKRERLSLCLRMACDWLEDDFSEWLMKTEEKTTRPLIAQLIWPDSNTEGEMTLSMQRMMAVLDFDCSQFQRLLEMVAELIRQLDRCGKQFYPFILIHSSNLGRELAVKLLPKIKEKGCKIVDDYLLTMKPDWLRLVTVSHVLSDLTGFQCFPELKSAITIFEHLEHIHKVGRQESRRKERHQQVEADPQLVAKFSKLKSVNASFRVDSTRLHMACHDNNVATVRALLTFPLLDLNATDGWGRTALQEGCRRGAEDCVRELLHYAPPIGSLQKRVNTRAADLQGKTALILATEGGHFSICRRLLQHSGSVLLDDVFAMNKSALDLCEAGSETFNVLQAYKQNRVTTIYSNMEMCLATEDFVLVANLAIALVLSYLEVHRTWDVYHAMKRALKLAKSGDNSLILSKPRAEKHTVACEYSRYHRDFRTHIPRVRVLAKKLKKSGLACDSHLLDTIVSLNQ